MQEGRRARFATCLQNARQCLSPLKPLTVSLRVDTRPLLMNRRMIQPTKSAKSEFCSQISQYAARISSISRCMHVHHGRSVSCLQPAFHRTLVTVEILQTRVIDMKFPWLCFLSILSYATAIGPVPVTHTGLAGIDGFTFYDPYCAHGCFRSFSPFKLQCSATVSPGGHTTADDAAHNLAVCRSSDFPFLSSIAWCIHSYCPGNVRASRIEKFWETEITGDSSVLPKWSYGEVLANITEPPTMMTMDMDMVLNMTMLTSYNTWKITQDTLIYFFRETALESYFG